jgi:hypothetical protein
MGFFDYLLGKKDDSGFTGDTLPSEMIRSFSEKNGKTASFIIEAEKDFPVPPFNGVSQRANRGGVLLYSKVFNGTMSVHPNYIQLDNSAALHKPKFDLGFEIELDYVLTIILKNNRWQMQFTDKRTKRSVDLPFHGFMYGG